MSSAQAAVQASVSAVSKYPKERRTTSTLVVRSASAGAPDQPEPRDDHGLVLAEAPARLAEQDRDLVPAPLVEAPLRLAPLLDGGGAGALGADRVLVDQREGQDRHADDLDRAAAHA